MTEAIRFLQEKEITTVESLDAHLDEVSRKAAAIRADMKKKEKFAEAHQEELSVFFAARRFLKPMNPSFRTTGMSFTQSSGCLQKKETRAGGTGGDPVGSEGAAECTELDQRSIAARSAKGSHGTGEECVRHAEAELED